MVVGGGGAALGQRLQKLGQGRKDVRPGLGRR